MVILTKITVFNEKVLLFIYVQRDSSRSLKNSSGPPTNQGIQLAQVCFQNLCQQGKFVVTRHVPGGLVSFQV